MTTVFVLYLHVLAWIMVGGFLVIMGQFMNIIGHCMCLQWLHPVYCNTFVDYNYIIEPSNQSPSLESNINCDNCNSHVSL